jgi:hypothetical protein
MFFSCEATVAADATSPYAARRLTRKIGQNRESQCLAEVIHRSLSAAPTEVLPIETVMGTLSSTNLYMNRYPSE